MINKDDLTSEKLRSITFYRSKKEGLFLNINFILISTYVN